MNCPICGFYSEDSRAAAHLPRFFRCPNCSGYYHREKNIPNYEETYFYEKTKPSVLGSIVSKLLGVFSVLYLARVRRLLSRKNGLILDYGCGDGKRVSYLNKKGFYAEGYDPSESAVRLAQKNNIPVFSAIPQKKYDLMMFWHSLEHSDQPFLDIQNCKKYLSANAKLLVAVPNADSFGAWIMRERWFGYDWPFHRVHFTLKAVRILLEKNGIRILSVDYFNPEYTIAFTAQTFLNLFLPKNVFYSAVSNRRKEFGGFKTAVLSALSLALLLLFSPFLLIFYIIELIAKRTGAFIVVAQYVEKI